MSSMRGTPLTVGCSRTAGRAGSPRWNTVQRAFPPSSTDRFGVGISHALKNDAVEAARAFLAEPYTDEPWTIVVQPEPSQEHPIARQVRFDSKEHLVAGEFGKAPFTRVVVLMPKDGSPVHFPPSHIPVADRLDLPTRGEWPPDKT
ncbi:hypothetical protein [Streptomyces sp. NPDC002133]|uniref:hypothetical protein n=1 Tax=Streptomyces sp. NPDC002133 TaxID=3154409 RepID=UPI00332FF7B5